MYRAIPIGNRICEKRNEQRRQELHREKIRTMRPSINTEEPKCLKLDHIRNNLKREQLLEERYGEIDRENRILLQKMSDIMRNPTGVISGSSSSSSGTGGHNISPNHNNNNTNTSSDNNDNINDNNNNNNNNTTRDNNNPVSLNKDRRKRELMRITNENQAILKRIQRAQPIYSHVAWEESHKKNKEYLRNCCEYPLVLRNKDGNNGNRIGSGIGGGTGAGIGGESENGKLDDYTKKSGSGNEDLKYLLKEGKKIGSSYYLIEMATDGRTLTISAYDGDTQKTLELLVNEKNHRRLYRECNGDYGVLAGRLRVESDRLVMADSNPLGGGGGGSGGGVGGGQGNSTGNGNNGNGNNGNINSGAGGSGAKSGQHVDVSVGKNGQGGVKLK